MTRHLAVIGWAIALVALFVEGPGLAICQIVEAQSGSKTLTPTDVAQLPTQTEVNEARMRAAAEIGRKSAIETQARGYWADPSTGLMWPAKDSGKDLSWKAAARYCRNLRTANYSDWRLADLLELEGIYDKSAFSPGLGVHEVEPTTWHVKGYLFLTAHEWSSDAKGGYSYYFDFNSGQFNDDPTGWPYGYDYRHALCVRGTADPLAVEPANHAPAAKTPETIFAVNQTLANGGDAVAAYELGLAYMQGYGVRQDLAQAEHWFRTVTTDPKLQSLIDLDAEARLQPAYVFELAETYRKDTPQQTARAAAMYLYLLKQTGRPEVRRAQMELGNFVLDGKYTAGSDASERMQNLEWARIITQELLGQEEYKIAVDYAVSREGLPMDPGMWLRFCKRAAAYNIDLAQRFLAEAISSGKVPNPSGYDDIAWTRLAADKQTGELRQLRAMESGMTPQQHHAADIVYDALVQTCLSDGAYYSPDDLLRSPAPEALAAMPKDDPDVQLRRAFTSEKAAQTDDHAYREAMDIYRAIRDRRKMDVRFALGSNYLNGTNGLPRNLTLARYWLDESAGFGSQPAKALLATFSYSQPN